MTGEEFAASAFPITSMQGYRDASCELAEIDSRIASGDTRSGDRSRAEVLKIRLTAFETRVEGNVAPPATATTKEADRNIQANAMCEDLRVMQERCGRLFDRMTTENMASDTNGNPMLYGPRELALARTKLREAFMWAHEAAFPAKRITLEED